VRAELLAGDERALYLLWLLSVQVEEVDDDAAEPAVPERLDRLTGAQTALAEFLRIDSDLLEVAASGSSPTSAGRLPDVADWVERLHGPERDGLLVALIEGNDPHLQAETLRRVRSDTGERVGVRTAGQLRIAAAARRGDRERANASGASAPRRNELVGPNSPARSGWRYSRQMWSRPGNEWRCGSPRKSRRATTLRWICWRIYVR
jgi:hypothetical protein